MKPQYLAMLGVMLAMAGCTTANTTNKSTSVHRQGSSTATITQDDGGSSPTTRRVIRRGPNSQTIIQEQGGNRVSITQN
jgi:hypothetical protein